MSGGFLHSVSPLLTPKSGRTTRCSELALLGGAGVAGTRRRDAGGASATRSDEVPQTLPLGSGVPHELPPTASPGLPGIGRLARPMEGRRLPRPYFFFHFFLFVSGHIWGVNREILQCSLNVTDFVSQLIRKSSCANDGDNLVRVDWCKGL